MNNTCIIVSASPVIDLERLQSEAKKPGCLIICADNGFTHAKNAGIKPDILVGDFDSMEKPDNDENLEIITLPLHKDDTDTLFAIRVGLERGCKDFSLFGSIGGRIDHSIANLSLLFFLQEHRAKGRIIDPICDIELLGKGTHPIPGKIDDTVSFLAFGQSAAGVTLYGFEYPLNEATVGISFPVGISNRIKTENASIRIMEGNLLFFRSKTE